jgi:DHA1 family tetracycline resistance protein-like MFS transporter
VKPGSPSEWSLGRSEAGGPSVYPILAVNFVGALGFSIVLPFLVFLVTRLGGNAVIYGIRGATYSVFQLVGAPVLGRWSDRVGRRKILLVSQLGTLTAWRHAV